MRVIAGTAKRLQLKTVEGMDTRPTTDRIKETLFNMISEYLADSNFLDLFSGSGAIGIEALSRGAAHASFVEQSKKAMPCGFHEESYREIENNCFYRFVQDESRVFVNYYGNAEKTVIIQDEQKGLSEKEISYEYIPEVNESAEFSRSCKFSLDFLFCLY